jgi:hypothetical protein
MGYAYADAIEKAEFSVMLMQLRRLSLVLC